MKKLLLFVLIFLFLPNLTKAEVQITPTPSEPCMGYFALFVDKNSAVANNTETIALTVRKKQNPGSNGAACIGGIPADYLLFSSTGSGNNFSSVRADLIISGSYDTYTTVTLKSSVAESKSISVFPYYGNEPDPMGSRSLGSLTFTTPPSTTPAPTSAPRKSTPKPAEQPNAEAANPAVPVLENLKVGNTEFAASKVAENTITTRKKINFRGKAIPNGKVTLYFHSDLFEATTTADKDGNWSYDLEPGKLDAGEHSLQIAVTDPATNKTSEKSTALKFEVKEEQVTPVATTDQPKQENILIAGAKTPYGIVAIFIFLTSIAFGTFYFLRLRKKTTN